jgi:hypothetical protein
MTSWTVEQNAEDERRRRVLPKVTRRVFVQYNRTLGKIEMLIGPGPVRIERRRITENHYHFAAYRNDRTIVFFYSWNYKGDSLPITCNAHDCALLSVFDKPRPDADPAASQGSQVGCRPVIYAQISPDLISNQRACVFLHNAEAMWNKRVDKAVKFTRDLSDPDSEFPWEIYLAGTEWGQQIREAGVACFFLVWVGEREESSGDCAFYVQYGNNVERVILPWRNCAEEEPVGYIKWYV